jgi:dihydrofolate reductase
MSGNTRYIAIAAMDEARGIGKDGKLPWKIPGDLKYFKEVTMGHPILFGRTTYEGIGRPLPGRENIVLSRTLPDAADVRVVRSLDELNQLARPLVYVCGGTEVYRQFLPLCEVLLLTRVRGVHDVDAWFPPFEGDFDFHTVEEETDTHRRERWTHRHTA